MCTHIVAAPSPPAPRQPMRAHDNGVKAMRKPTRALYSHKVILHSQSVSHLNNCSSLKWMFCLHRSRISKRVSQLSLYFTLRRQIQLLKQLRRHVDARCGAEPVEGIQTVGIGVDIVAISFFFCHDETAFVI